MPDPQPPPSSPARVFASVLWLALKVALVVLLTSPQRAAFLYQNF
jgi:hypothetical protein